MKELRLHPLAASRFQHGWRRACRVERWSSGELEGSLELVYELPEWIELPGDSDCDGYVRALLLDAMREGRLLRICGAASKKLLGNIEELQGMWRRLKPREYSIVKVLAEVVEDTDSRAEGAVCAFSGGVDASFTMWRHASGRCGLRSQKVNMALLVHGFDIPLDDEGIREAAKSGEAMARDLGIPFAVVRTNFRKVVQASWLDVFGLAVVSAMDQVKRHGGTGLLASCEPYGSLVEALGSTPISDHLMSGGSLEVIHDGATHSRIEKINDLKEWPEGLRRLRVCWQENAHGSNCGRCEKCVRNKMCFLVSELEIPENFPACDLPYRLALSKMLGPAHATEWELIFQYAAKRPLPNYVRDCLWLMRIRPRFLRWVWYGLIKLRYGAHRGPHIHE